jgi:hypothetical protein
MLRRSPETEYFGEPGNPEYPIKTGGASPIRLNRKHSLQIRKEEGKPKPGMGEKSHFLIGSNAGLNAFYGAIQHGAVVARS